MITIRKATRNDAAPLAACLLLAMEEIVYKFIGQRSPEEARRFMLYFVEREKNQYSYQNCFVATIDGNVVGAVNVYDGAKLYELREPVLFHIRSQYHHAVSPEDETAEGEYYIDSLGVMPAYWGRGIGSRLLQYLLEEFVQKQEQTLGLLVDEDNPSARRLYLRLGFTPSGVKTLLGKTMEHLQIRKETRLQN